MMRKPLSSLSLLLQAGQQRDYAVIMLQMNTTYTMKISRAYFLHHVVACIFTVSSRFAFLTKLSIKCNKSLHCKLAKSICIFVLRQAVNISHTLNQTKLENWSTFFITSLRLNWALFIYLFLSAKHGNTVYKSNKFISLRVSELNWDTHLGTSTVSCRTEFNLNSQLWNSRQRLLVLLMWAASVFSNRETPMKQNIPMLAMLPISYFALLKYITDSVHYIRNGSLLSERLSSVLKVNLLW